jgi:tetratricopeptide (TPR) repeat protein
MELTLDQVLQKGVEAHKAGKVQEADRYYTAILKANPKHPDANHNMGVLAVGVGKVQEALPFFKTALEENPKIEQFWPSYMDALIKLDRLADAKAVFDQAKNAGMKGDGFDQIENRLGSFNVKNSNTQDPPQAQLQELIDLFNKGDLQKALDQSQTLSLQYRSAILLNIQGAAFQGLGRLDLSVEAFNNALSIKPDYADVHNNMGNSLREQGQLGQAVEAYKKALSIKPDYADAHNNMGLTLQEQGKPEEAIESYTKALSIKPDDPSARSNLAILLFESRRFEKAARLFSMDDFIKNQNYLLKCFYELDKKSKFYKQLDYLIERGENNCVIGSYTSRSKIRYGVKRQNPFCNDPLKYVERIDLSKKCDFKEIFINNAANVLSNDQVKNKSQGLLKNGIQTAGNIFTQVGSVANLWQEIIRAELTKYRDLFYDSDEGLIRDWPSDYSIYGWLISMKKGGELSAHIHEKGWISGSIYINVPPKSKKDSGNLVVTTHGPKDGKRNSKDMKSIDVVTGSLCLFPSSLLHYTIPFDSEDDRTVLAFDVIPNK